MSGELKILNEALTSFSDRDEEWKRKRFFRIFNSLTKLDKTKAMSIVMQSGKKDKSLKQKDSVVREKLWLHYGYVADKKVFSRDILRDFNELKRIDPDVVSYY
jgi:hypothetical protein